MSRGIKGVGVPEGKNAPSFWEAKKLPKTVEIMLKNIIITFPGLRTFQLGPYVQTPFPIILDPPMVSDVRGRSRGGGGGSWGSGPPFWGTPKLHKEGKKCCAHACENVAF